MHQPLKIAFQPPSDMGNMNSGGNQVWKVLGLGCAFIVLISGLALAFGSYKVASVCGSGIDVVKTAMNAQKYGADFAADISKSDFDIAYGKMTSVYQKDISKADFNAMFAKYKISGAPVARGFNANQTNTLEEYKASYFFTVESGSEMPTIEFTIVKGEGEGNNNFKVNAFDIFLAKRNVDKELPGQMVIRFHDQIAKGQDSIAYMSMGESFRTKTGQDVFIQFLKDAGPVFTSGRWEIQSIKYHTGESATVMAISRYRSGSSMIIQFEMAKTEQMGFPLWQIEAIAPLVAGDPPSDSKIIDEPKKEDAVDSVKIPKIDKPVEKPTKN